MNVHIGVNETIIVVRPEESGSVINFRGLQFTVSTPITIQGREQSGLIPVAITDDVFQYGGSSVTPGVDNEHPTDDGFIIWRVDHHTERGSVILVLKFQEHDWNAMQLENDKREILSMNEFFASV